MPRRMFTDTTATLDEQQTISQILQIAQDAAEEQKQIDEWIEAFSERDELPDDATAQMRERIRARMSQEKIRNYWLAQGGPASPVGLPKDPMFPLQKTDSHYVAEFRSGPIKIQHNGERHYPADTSASTGGISPSPAGIRARIARPCPRLPLARTSTTGSGAVRTTSPLRAFPRSRGATRPASRSSSACAFRMG